MLLFVGLAAPEQADDSLTQVDVASISDAAEIAQRAPHTALGGGTIVRPIMAIA